jgi:predicted nucleotidyltransferase
MDKGAVVKIVDRFRHGIEARGIKAQKVILYGSHAVGTSATPSDIDVVIISEDFAGKGYWERGDSFVVDFARTGEVLYAA